VAGAGKGAGPVEHMPCATARNCGLVAKFIAMIQLARLGVELCGPNEALSQRERGCCPPSRWMTSTAKLIDASLVAAFISSCR
jgi:hypothetical protein